MITQELINNVLLNDSGKHLKKEYKVKWNEKNPTFGYCYIVSEAIYHYGNLNNDYKPYCLNLQKLGNHWYLSNGTDIIDFTRNQFSFEIDYSKGQRKAFLKGSISTNKGFISKRGYKIAKLLHLIEN